MTEDRSHMCDLTIEPVLPLDEGKYECQVSGVDGIPPIASPPVFLSVNSEPGKPHILQAREKDLLEVKEGEEVELECQSQGGKPPAELQWWDGKGNRIVSNVREEVSRMGEGKTFKTVSHLKFVPKKSVTVLV